MVKRIGLALISLCLSLGMMELGLRLTGSAVHDYHYEVRKAAKLAQMHEVGGYLMNPPNSTAVIEGHPMRFNSLGMRDVEPSLPKPEGVCRLLIVGDSVTFGSGVAQESIYGYRMREHLQQTSRGRLTSGRSGPNEGACAPDAEIDVVIAAVPGWNTLEQERFLRTNLDTIDPDLVMLTYVPNDRLFDNPFLRARKEGETAANRIYRRLILGSRLFEWGAFVYQSRFAEPDWEVARELSQWLKSQEPKGKPFSADDPGWLRSRQALLDIRAFLGERGIELVIVSYRLTKLGMRDAAAQALRRLSQETDVPVYDTLTFFAGTPTKKLMNQPGVDPHPNADAHAIIAERLTKILVDEGHLFRHR